MRIDEITNTQILQNESIGHFYSIKILQLFMAA